MPYLARPQLSASCDGFGTTKPVGCGGSGSDTPLAYRSAEGAAVKFQALGVVLKISAMGRARASFRFIGGRPKTSSMVRTKSIVLRSEERRVGKECRSRWSPYH